MNTAYVFNVAFILVDISIIIDIKSSFICGKSSNKWPKYYNQDLFVYLSKFVKCLHNLLTINLAIPF